MDNQLEKIEKKLRSGGWYRTAFLGDSITSTEWVHPNWREIVEYVLKSELETSMGEWEIPWWKMRFYNAGFNGGDTAGMIKFIDEELALYKPDLVIFMDTYNDKHRNITPEAHKNNLEIIFEKLAGLCETVVFANSIAQLKDEDNDINEKYMAKADEAAARFKDRIMTVDLYGQFRQLELGKFFTFVLSAEDAEAEPGRKTGEIDSTHPNQLGNAYIAKIMLKEIFGLGFDPESYIKETLAGKKYPAY